MDSPYSYAVRREIYLSWKPVFSHGNNAQLRKRAKIADLVRQYASRRFWHPNLISILKSLLEDHIFSSEFRAQKAFPDIYKADQKVDCAPPKTTYVEQAPEPAEPMDELRCSLIELYRSGLYSDLTIICRGKRYQVHKAVVCPRSDFFAAACRPGFKEAREGEIDLSDDDPTAVAAVVNYFYHLDYTPIDSAEPDGAASIDEEQAQLADATKISVEATTSTWTSASLVIHARVYALAEKYIVKGLKALALQKFKASASRADEEDWVANFLTAAEETYTSTVEADRELRSVVLQAFQQKPRLLDEDRTQTLLKKLSSLTFDLLMYERRVNAEEDW